MPRRWATLWLLALAALPGGATADEVALAEPTVVFADPVDPRTRWDLEVDYLYWFLRPASVGPVLTTGTPASGGVLGAPGTQVLYPTDGELHSRHDRFVGVRAAAETWFGADCRSGLQVDTFFLERDSSVLNLKDPPPGLLIARPYTDAVTGQPRSEIIAGTLPDGRVVAGRANIYQRVETFGQQVNWLQNIDRGCAWTVDGLAGVRLLQMRDRFDVTAVSRVLPDEATLLGQTDHFWTFNKFVGGQLGLRGEYAAGLFSLSGFATAAIGATDQEINAKGDRTFNDPTRRDVTPEGLYVRASNTGHYQSWDFDWVGEVGVTLGVDLTRHLRATAGYSFLYWDGPVRASDQIDAVNLGGGGPARPVIPFREDYFWAQGLRVGLAVCW